MAGIGFVLRKLSEENSLRAPLESFFRAAFIAAGPWLMTVFTLATINYAGRFYSQFDAFTNFQSIILYNFCFSLVLSSPLGLGITRYLADLIYLKETVTVPGIVVGSSFFLTLFWMPLVFYFWGFYAFLDQSLRFFAISNFFLISLMWHLSVFMTALVNYQVVTGAYLVGMIFAGIFSLICLQLQSAVAMMAGFNLGITFTVAFLLGETFLEYPAHFYKPFSFLPSLKKYGIICLSGLLYNSAAWVDKWVMWFSPYREKLDNNLILFSYYDSAAFVAYIVTIPAMAFFLIYVETDFFEKYLHFYEAIRKNASFQQIVMNQSRLQTSLAQQSRNVILIQGIIVFFVLGLSSQLFSIFGMNYMQLGIFRMCVIGASYQIFILFLSIILWYFDSRYSVLKIHLTFLITNGLFTYATLFLDFGFYGLGFALSTIVTYVYAAILTKKELEQLPYYTFIRNNSSVQ